MDFFHNSFFQIEKLENVIFPVDTL